VRALRRAALSRRDGREQGTVPNGSPDLTSLDNRFDHRWFFGSNAAL